MKLLTIDEIIASILEETKGLDVEITNGIILKKNGIPPSEIENLKSELEIERLDPVFTELILNYNWGNFGFLSYQFGYNDEASLNWLIHRNLEYTDYPVLHNLDLIIIANGDPYTIYLNVHPGKYMHLQAR